MANIKVNLKNTDEYSQWNKQLDGLTGELVGVEKSCWGGYTLQVKLDNPPSWCNKKSIQVYACEKGRDVIVEFSKEELHDVMLMTKGLMTITRNPICAICGKVDCVCNKILDMGEVNGVKLSYFNGNVFATPKK